MKIKLDEDPPVDLSKPLAWLGHDVDMVVQQHLTGKDDPRVWEAAQEENRFLILQDVYVTNLREHSPGAHHGVLLAGLVDPSCEALIRRIVSTFETEDVTDCIRCNGIASFIFSEKGPAVPQNPVTNWCRPQSKAGAPRSDARVV